MRYRVASQKEVFHLKLTVLQVLEKQGKSKYWLYKQLGLSYQNFNRMVNNKTKSIKFENLEALCQILQCTPNDILRPDFYDEDLSL